MEDQWLKIQIIQNKIQKNQNEKKVKYPWSKTESEQEFTNILTKQGYTEDEAKKRFNKFQSDSKKSLKE